MTGEIAKSLDELAAQVTDEMAKALWDLYPLAFLRPDSGNRIAEFKKPFLAWLLSQGIDPLVAGIDAINLANDPTPLPHMSSVSSPQGEVTQRRRARLEEVSHERVNDSFMTKVRLSMHQQEVQACKRAGPSEAGPRVTARATIEAVRRLVPLVNLDLRAAYTVESREESEKRLAIVVLGEESAGELREYAGASSVLGVESEAVARATLAALNRRVDWEQPLPVSAGRMFPKSSEARLKKRALWEVS